MKARTTPTPRKPKLCVLASAHLRELVMPLVAEFRERADIEVDGTNFGNTLELAREHLERGIDAFVSAGYAAAVLRSALGVPVGVIQVSGFDLLQVLLAGRRFSTRIGVVMYANTIPDLDAVRELLNIELVQFSYHTPMEARERVDRLQREGYGVVIGSNIVVEHAERSGLKGLIAYSPASVRDGLEAGLELARAARREASRFDQLNGVLHNLHEAVVAVDREHRIIALNQPMQRLLGSDAPALGQPLSRVGPELSLMEVLQNGSEERGRVQRFAGRDWIANRTPLLEEGDVVGATLTLYNPRDIQEADTRLRIQHRSQQSAARHSFETLMGRSERFTRALARARRFACNDLTVLVIGESGTGKELFAQAIHNASSRGNRPFIAVNCAAFAEALLESELFGHEEGAFTGSRRGGKQGLFEAAHTGTLFLDEIGDMPLSLQTRLLRVLQERQILRVGATTPIPVDVRVIAATHQPLQTLIAANRFRQDLYYRLNTLHLPLPPLRERFEDIDLLARAHLARALGRLDLPWDAARALAPLAARMHRYRWPGNVRELENVCERIAVFLQQFERAEDIRYDDLEEELPELFDAGPAARTDPEAQREKVSRALAQQGGNRPKAARVLGVSRSTLWRWCRELGLDAPAPASAQGPADPRPAPDIMGEGQAGV